MALFAKLCQTDAAGVCSDVRLTNEREELLERFGSCSHRAVGRRSQVTNRRARTGARGSSAAGSRHFAARAAPTEEEAGAVLRLGGRGMAGDSKIHAFEEVSKHNVTQDCWLIINGKVYDVTPFMDEHPGGDEVLLAATGKDASNDFEDVGHSDSARELMDKYYIGEIDASTVPAKRSYIPPQQAPYNPDKTTDFVTKILQFLVPLLILGLAFAVRHYTKTD